MNHGDVVGADGGWVLALLAINVSEVSEMRSCSDERRCFLRRVEESSLPVRIKSDKDGDHTCGSYGTDVLDGNDHVLRGGHVKEDGD